MQSKELQEKLRAQRCRRRRPVLAKSLGEKLGRTVTLDQFLPLAQSDGIRRLVGARLRASSDVLRVVWPGGARESVFSALEGLAIEIEARVVVLLQSYTADLGALRFLTPEILPKALDLCVLGEEDAILVTEDTSHGIYVEHNDHDDEGQECEEYVLSLWGDFAKVWRRRTHAPEA